MAEPGNVFDFQMKVKNLKNMVPELQRYLVPSKLVPYLFPVLMNANPTEMTVDVGSGEEMREKILELEQRDREAAVTMLLDVVFERGEYGVNHFIAVLSQHEWERFVAPLENRDLDTCRASSEYGAFILRMLEGEIIKKLTGEDLLSISRGLLQEETIDEMDLETVNLQLRHSGLGKAAVQLFTLMSRHREDWPVKFFAILQQVKPALLTKIDLSVAYDNEESPSKKDLSPDSQSKEASSDSESDQTEVKTMTGLHQDADIGTRYDDDDISDDDSADVDAGSDDDTSGEFSDNEKQDDEESEKKHAERPRDPGHPPKLSLRAYQQELAAPALKGLNTIICAPTGSGKTRVALNIVQKHLEAKGPSRKKVVFLARTVPLVTQQHRNFQKYLPNYKSVLVTGESEFSMHLHHLLPDHDILVLTPKILENHLVPEKIPSLAAFSLLIFDECHHTRKGEPYNSLMKSYLKSKKKGKERLPQIVGLTASIGVEKATTVTEAVQSILGIMGNLDVSCISVVKQNLQELQDTVPVPKEEFAAHLVSRDGDEVSQKIENIMHQIEELLIENGSELHDSEISKLLMNMPPNCREQLYGQWAVMLRNQTRLLKFDDTKKSEIRKKFAREVQVLSDFLVAYNEALEVHDLTRPQDVLEYLDRKFRAQFDKFQSTKTESKVFDYFTDLKKMLMKHRNEENPNLKTLSRTIKDHLETEGRESQIIIFVRTRATCQALCRWLNNSKEKDLQQLKAAAFTGTGAHQEEGGMTLPEQEGVIQKFRNGDVKLLVTTSVGEEGIDIPECNLVIKYNHVGNEVTTVQTRGRSRKKGGRSILMAKPKIMMQEVLNKQRAEMMYKAIERVNHMSPDSIVAEVQQVQKKTMESEEIKDIVRRTKKLSKLREPFSLVCCQCKKLRVKSEHVRTINNSHHVIIGHQYDEQVIRRQSKEPRRVDDLTLNGSVSCKECGNHLGQIVNYAQVRFMSIGLRFWIVLNKNNDPMAFKNWKDVPYKIEELSPADIKMHLGVQDDSLDGSDSEEGAIGGVDE